jgi:hypothetical protein
MPACVDVNWLQIYHLLSKLHQLAPVQVLKSSKSKSHSSTLPIKSGPKTRCIICTLLKHSFLHVLVLESLNNPIKMDNKVQFFIVVYAECQFLSFFENAEL